MISRHHLFPALVSTVLIAAPALAENASGGPMSDSSQTSGELPEIVVTAQKRVENLQIVPIAITTVDADLLNKSGVQSTHDLNMVVPSVSFNENAGTVSTYIRGIGTAVSNGGNESSVATYVDGVYYASAASAVLSLNNISQISVLKGPQGTLFGKNATGGVIQITTRDPTQEFHAEANGTFGNLSTYGVSGYVTGGITPGLAADLAVGFHDQTRGFGKNLFSGRDVNKERDLSLRSKWKAELGSETTATVILDYQGAKQANPAFRPLVFNGGDFNTNSNIAQPIIDITQWGTSLDLQHDFGPVKLVSISAYRHSLWKANFDSDSLPIDILTLDLNQRDEQFSQELQLVSNDQSKLEWVVGLYYFNAYGTLDPAVVGGTISNFFQTILTKQKTRSIAAFGQASYAFTPTTSLTLGFRATSDKKSIDGSGKLFIPVPGITRPLGPYSAEATVNKPTWRISLDQKLSPHVMAYVSYNRGFKSGGYDPTQIAAPSYFAPEVIDAYELGVKSELFDRRLRLNAAGFYYDYKDPQLNTLINSLPHIYNGAGAKVYGIDLDMTALVTKGLTFTAGLSGIHGRYEDFPVIQTIVTPTTVVVLGPNISAKDKMLQNTPSFQAKLGADYLKRLPNDNTVDVSVNYSYQSRTYAAPENRLTEAPFSLVNAAVTWASDPSGRFSVSLWGKNLTNEVYYAEFGTQVNVGDFSWIAPGRTYGATVGVKF